MAVSLNVRCPDCDGVLYVRYSERLFSGETNTLAYCHQCWCEVKIASKIKVIKRPTSEEKKEIERYLKSKQNEKGE